MVEKRTKPKPKLKKARKPPVSLAYEVLKAKQQAAEAAEKLEISGKEGSVLDADAWMLIGVEIPPKQVKGKPSQEQRLKWLAATETLMTRGVDTPGRVAQLLDVKFEAAAGWMQAIYDSWGRAVKADEINLRRMALYQEAAEIGRLAMRQAMCMSKPKDKALYLRVALDANKRQAALFGLDSTKVDVEHVVRTVEGEMSPAEFAQRYGLDPVMLATLGRMSAQGLSTAARRTLDAQLVDEREEVAAARDQESNDAP